MADYSIASLLRSGTAANVTELLAVLQDDLPVVVTEVSADGPTAITSGTATTLETATITAVADEAIIAFYRCTLACNSVSSTRSFAEIQIKIDGTQYGKPSNVYTDYENNSKDGATAVTWGYATGKSGSISVLGQGRVTWDTGSGDTVYFGNRDLIVLQFKYRT